MARSLGHGTQEQLKQARRRHVDSAATAYRDGGEEQNEGCAIRLEVADPGIGFDVGAGRSCARSLNALCDRAVDVDHVESSCHRFNC